MAKRLRPSALRARLVKTWRELSVDAKVIVGLSAATCVYLTVVLCKMGAWPATCAFVALFVLTILTVLYVDRQSGG